MAKGVYPKFAFEAQPQRRKFWTTYVSILVEDSWANPCKNDWLILRAFLTALNSPAVVAERLRHGRNAP